MSSYISHTWMVSWTANGDIWYERVFESFKRAQEFARGLVGENAGSPSFAIYAERMMAVNLTSFLNAGSAGAVELAPHLLGTADTFA